MESKPTTVEELFEKLKDYADTRLKLFKLQGINKASGYFSSAITIVILSILFITVILCITVGLALVIGESLGEAYYGFFIMAGIYLIIGLVLFAVRGKVLKSPISNKLIKELFK